MAVTLGIPTQTGPTQWRFTFTSDLPDPIFYIYVNGEYVTQTRETFYDVTIGINQQVQFDVLDVVDDLPDEYFPGAVTLRWDGTPDATSFRIEQYVGSEWIAKHVVIADDSRIFHYESELLDDSEVHQFRIVPVDDQGRDGTILEFEAEMCRYPDEPSQAMSITGGEFVVA
jgi:hypothetical protein